MINSIGNTIAIGFFGSIAIAIAIGKTIFQLLLLLLLRGLPNYCYWGVSIGSIATVFTVPHKARMREQFTVPYWTVKS